MIKNLKPITALFILALLTVSCSDDSKFVSEEIAISESDEHSISYQENEEALKFIVEDLNNLSMNFDPADSARDFLIMYVDVNNNNSGDANLDKIYSAAGNPIQECFSFYLTPTSTTPCIAEDGYVLTTTFQSTAKNPDEHVVYEVIIRKDAFPSTNEIGLIFRMGGEDAGGYVPTLTPKFYDNTLVISWD